MASYIHGERGAGKKEDERSFPWIMLFPCLTIRFDVGPMYGLNQNYKFEKNNEISY